MNAPLPAFPVAVIGLIVCGCESPATIKVFNATGGELAVQTDPYWTPKPISVQPAEATRAFIGGLSPDLEVTSQGCRRRYSLPAMNFNMPFGAYDAQGRPLPNPYTYPIGLQVEADHTIYLLPPGTLSIMPLGNLQRREAHGYPLRPATGGCAPPAG